MAPPAPVDDQDDLRKGDAMRSEIRPPRTFLLCLHVLLLSHGFPLGGRLDAMAWAETQWHRLR